MTEALETHAVTLVMLESPRQLSGFFCNGISDHDQRDVGVAVISMWLYTGNPFLPGGMIQICQKRCIQIFR